MVQWFKPHYVTHSTQLITAIVCTHTGLAVTSACRQTFTSESYNITMRLQMYKYWHAAPTSPTTHPLYQQGREDGADVDPTDILTAAHISTPLRNLSLTPRCVQTLHGAKQASNWSAVNELVFQRTHWSLSGFPEGRHCWRALEKIYIYIYQRLSGRNCAQSKKCWSKFTFKMFCLLLLGVTR